MEKTIFDYDVTGLEISVLRITDSKEEYVSEQNELVKLYHIHRLLSLRGEKEKANEILNEIYYNITSPNIS